MTGLLLALAALVSLRAPAALPDGPAHGVWPLAGQPEVVRRFDPPASTWSAGHRGVDLLGRVGTPVRSALAGTVTFAGSIAGRGVVVVDHGRTRTTYEPVSATARVGDVVSAGAPIGTLQAAQGHCPPRACLHWGLIEGDTYLDPLTLVGLGPIRLLPVAGQVMPAGAPGGRPSGDGRW